MPGPMQLFSRLPERRLRLVRWTLLIGWLLLIASLLLPVLALPEALMPPCSVLLDPDCQLHRQPGNRLFWGTVVPMGVLMIGVLSHELWRRICPLAFVSQLARALGRQRSRPGPLAGSAAGPAARAARRWCRWRPTPGWDVTIWPCSGAC
jgi:hypothetical protein